MLIKRCMNKHATHEGLKGATNPVCCMMLYNAHNARQQVREFGPADSRCHFPFPSSTHFLLRIHARDLLPSQEHRMNINLIRIDLVLVPTCPRRSTAAQLQGQLRWQALWLQKMSRRSSQGGHCNRLLGAERVACAEALFKSHRSNHDMM